MNNNDRQTLNENRLITILHGRHGGDVVATTGNTHGEALNALLAKRKADWPAELSPAIILTR